MAGYDGLALSMYDKNSITFTDDGAHNFFAINIVDGTTMTTGYSQAFYSSITSSGSKSGGQSGAFFCGFATDIFLSGVQTGWVAGVGVYVAATSTPSSASDGTVDGVLVVLDALGVALHTRSGFHCFSAETSAYEASIQDGGLIVECMSTGGTWGSTIFVYGQTPPLYFLKMVGMSALGLDGRMVIESYTYSGHVGVGLRCKIGATEYIIPCNAVTS